MLLIRKLMSQYFSNKILILKMSGIYPYDFYRTLYNKVLDFSYSTTSINIIYVYILI